MSVKRRLRRLEARVEVEAADQENTEKSRRTMDLYFKAYENARREMEGLEPIPLTEEEQRWQRELDEENGGMLDAYFDELEKEEKQRAKNPEAQSFDEFDDEEDDNPRRNLEQ